MKMPTARVARSPSPSAIRPQNGLVSRRMKAKADTTIAIWKLVTSNDLANTGRTGTTTPKPTATQKAMMPRTMTSRGTDVRRRTQPLIASLTGAP